MKYISLHTMTEYSFLKSTIKIDDLINFAIQNELKALAITDRNNMFGVGEFVNKCKTNNIKPIIGVDLDVADYRFIVLAKNFLGFKKLSHLVSLKQRRGLELNEINDENLIIIDHLTKGYFAKEQTSLSWDNFYLSTNNLNGEGVFFQETRSLSSQDQPILSVLDSLRENKMVEAKEDVQGYQLISSSDKAILQAIEIAKMCNVEFLEHHNLLTKFANGENLDSETYLKKIITEKLTLLLENVKDKIVYIERAKYELNTITKLRFSDYFLIISDVISWAKQQGIAVGPGRGSAAGSLISFLLDITEIDPIRFDLLFERFLNPERVTMPDIDIDIQDNRRDEVINYIFEKYGQEKVALISTFQKLAAKSAIRDVARLKGLSNPEALALTKLVPNNTNLQEAFDESVRFRAAISKTEANLEIFNLAKSIEGLPRQMGTHAAGIVISDENIENKVPTILSSEGLNQVQYSMGFLEESGLLKIDILGLRNLTIIQNIEKEIYKNYNKKLDLKNIRLDDEKTNKILSHGDTNGIFQFESYGMKKTLINVKVDHFSDIAVILSLYRPGPMEYINTYALRKKGLEVVPKISLEYDKVVKETYGIIVYQEQIMQIAQRFAGMSFAQADILRRAIGKKKILLIQKLQKTFIDGAVSKGNTKDLAIMVYKQIEAFANYGFNKSHAVAYATIAYRLAFLKARFPLEFYSAILQSSLGSLPTLKTYIYEAKKRNIDVISPNINYSTDKIVNQKKSIILPLIMIKGLGKVAVQKIIQERSKSPFKDFFDLVSRLKLNGLGQTIVTTLIKANALRDFANMQTLLDSLAVATRYAEMILITEDGIKKLDHEIISKPQLIESKQDINQEVKAEETIYGFAIEASLTKKYELKNRLIDLPNIKQGPIVAIVEKIKKLKDKNGNEMAIVTLTDSTNTIEAFVFSSIYKSIKNTKKGTLVHVDLAYNEQRNSYNLRNSWKEINE